MTVPTPCVSCSKKECESYQVGEMEICEFGVAFFWLNESAIVRKEIPFSQHRVASNLRHELHKYIQFIVRTACEIDPNISLDDLKTASSAPEKIVAVADMLDKEVEQIAKVNEVRGVNESLEATNEESESIVRILHKCKNQYALIKSVEKASDFSIEINASEDAQVGFAKTQIEHLVSIL